VADLSVTYLRVHALEDVLKSVIVQRAVGESEAADCESPIVSGTLEMVACDGVGAGVGEEVKQA
jgi:microcompartment protein CcmK/EutM